jgi:hypothetical protein
MRLSSPLCKKNWLRRTPKSAIYPLTSRPSEGAYRDRHGRRGGMRWTPSMGRGDSHNSDAIRVAGRRRRARSSLRGANGSRECAPDDRLRDEAIHPCFLMGYGLPGFVMTRLTWCLKLDRSNLTANAPRSRCHHPRKRVIQYSEASMMDSKGLGVLDTPHAV